MNEMISILLEALMIVSRDLALYEGQNPSEIAALALFASSLKARSKGSDSLALQLKRLEPAIYSVLAEITSIVDTSEN